MMFSDPAGRNKAATPRPHGSVPINREDYVVPMSIPGTGRNAIVSRSHDVDTAGGQDRVAREDYRAQVLAEIREDLSRRGIDLADRMWSDQNTAVRKVEDDNETESLQVDEGVNSQISVEEDLKAENNADDDIGSKAESTNSTDDTENVDSTDSVDPTDSTETEDSSWDSWGDEADEFDDVFGDDDELADSEDIPEDLDGILGDDLDDIPDDV